MFAYRTAVVHVVVVSVMSPHDPWRTLKRIAPSRSTMMTSSWLVPREPSICPIPATPPSRRRRSHLLVPNQLVSRTAVNVNRDVNMDVNTNVDSHALFVATLRKTTHCLLVLLACLECSPSTASRGHGDTYK